MNKIILKRNNMPTNVGDYLSALYGGFAPTNRRVVDRDGGLMFMDDSGTWKPVECHQLWSDRIGPVEFEESEPVRQTVGQRAVERMRDFTEKLEAGEIEMPDHLPDATKKVPERLRQGTFEYERENYRVVDYDAGDGPPCTDYFVTPQFEDESFIEKSTIELYGIEITWHDEPQAVDGKEQFVDGWIAGYGWGYASADEDLPEEYDLAEMAESKWNAIHEQEPQPVEIEPGQKWKHIDCYPREVRVIRNRHDCPGKEWGMESGGLVFKPPGMTSKTDLQAWLNEHAEHVPEETA